MKKIITFLFILFLGLSVKTTGAAGLADSPWPCKGHDARRTGQSHYVGAQTNALKWSFQTEGSILSSPVIGEDGTIYFGSDDGSVYALTPAGTLKWKYQLFSECEFHKTQQEDKFFSPPCVGANGTIYIGSSDGNFYNLKPDGTLKWSYQMEDTISSSPVIGTDGTVYFGSEEGNIYALGPDGSLKWNYQTDTLPFSLPWPKPAPVCNPSLAINIDGTLCAHGSILDQSTTISSFSLPFPFCLFRLDQSGSLISCCRVNTTPWSVSDRPQSSPVIDIDGKAYIAGDCIQEIALNSTLTGDSGDLQDSGWDDWNCYLNPIRASSVALGDNGTLYIAGIFIGHLQSISHGHYLEERWTHYGKIYAVNSDGGVTWSRELWSRTFQGCIWPTFINEIDYYASDLYGTPGLAIGADGTVYVGTGNESIYALDPNGTVKWSYATGGLISTSPAIGADGTVYIGCDDGKLYAFGPGPADKEDTEHKNQDQVNDPGWIYSFSPWWFNYPWGNTLIRYDRGFPPYWEATWWPYGKAGWWPGDNWLLNYVPHYLGITPSMLPFTTQLPDYSYYLFYPLS
ncbi:MAG: PQQ-binding-like beta-propeller repeat protein [bacterium]